MWVGVCFFGLGMSATFPTIMALTNRYVNLAGKAMSVFFFGTMIGATLFPLVLGVITTEQAPVQFMILIFCMKVVESFVSLGYLFTGPAITDETFEKQ